MHMRKANIGEKIIGFMIVVFLSIFSIIILIPLLNVVLSSFSPPEEAVLGTMNLFPQKFSLAAYKLILFASDDIVKGYIVTVARVAVGTALNMFFSYVLAYLMAKDDLPGNKAITIFVFFIILFNGGLIPYYIVVILSGLQNSFWVYIIPTLVQAYNVLLLRNFIMHIPSSYSESASLDGASENTILFRIIMPLSVPAMVTIGLFYAVAHWNDWFTTFLFIKDSDKYTVQAVLRNILAYSSIRFDGSNTRQLNALINNPPPSHVIQAAAVVITTLPITLLYPFLQKHFVKGIMVGGIKG